MEDLKPFNHGDEETHFVCPAHVDRKECCGCNWLADCDRGEKEADKPSSPPFDEEKSWEAELEQMGKLVVSTQVGGDGDEYDTYLSDTDVFQKLKDFFQTKLSQSYEAGKREGREEKEREIENFCKHEWQGNSCNKCNAWRPTRF